MFATATVVVSVVIVVMSARIGRASVAAALGLILGGALGNLTDRALNGPALSGDVVDFIDFHIWPVFNVADTAIVAGAILLAVATGRRERSLDDDKRGERPPKREEFAGGT